MRALISGMSGFVGTHLARTLRHRNIQVFGFGIRPNSAADELKDCEYHLCDITDFSALSALVQSIRPQQIYHLAALARPGASLKAPLECYRVNSLGTVNLLESLRQTQTNSRVLIVSSAYVYQPSATRVSLREDARVQPRLPYGVSKWMSEQIALQYFHDYGLSILIARPFNHSGPGQEPGYVMPDFARQIAQLEVRSGGQIRVGNLNPVRDFLHVQDVVDAYIDLLDKGTEGEIYNVSSGEGISIREILNDLITYTEVDCEVFSNDLSPKPDYLVGDAGKLIRATGWSPRKSVPELLQDVLRDWRARTAANARV